MNTLILAVDLSRRVSLQRARDWFSRDDSTVLITIVTLLGVILTGLAIAALWQHLQEWRLEPERRRPLALFRRLQRRLGLRWIDRWRLWRLAWQLQLPHPTAILLSDMFFDQCVEKLATLRKLKPVQVAPYHAIRQQLFA